MFCDLKQRAGAWHCTNCKGRPLKGNYKRICKVNGPAPEHVGPPGSGYHLKRILARLRLTGKLGCGCNRHAAEMDKEGPDWCEANIDTIVGWMRKAAKKRTRIKKIAMPFTSTGAALLVRVAIRRARRDVSGHS